MYRVSQHFRSKLKSFAATAGEESVQIENCLGISIGAGLSPLLQDGSFLFVALKVFSIEGGCKFENIVRG